MDGLRILSVGSAVSTAVADGVLVGGWLAAAEHQGDAPRRRRARQRLSGAFTAQLLLDELAWELARRRAAPTAEPSSIDARSIGQALVLGAAATAVLSPLEQRAPRALARRGLRHPHLAFGAVSGIAYAACVLPIWLAAARRRAGRLRDAAAPVPPETEPGPELDGARPDQDGTAGSLNGSGTLPS